jgi:hypothetical protein
MSLKKQKRKDKPENSSMVNNEEELRNHSKIMENMSTNLQIKKNNKLLDPQQYEEKK